MATAYVGNDEFWRECASWLTQLELLRPDHRVNWSTAIIADLANTLRDGVLLCNLLNKLDHSCIDSKDISQKPSMAQFLCLRNINKFLKICKDNFDLKDSDLFEPLMLFDLSNFHRVLCTLSKLSLSPKAKIKSNGFSAQVEKTEEEEEIYQSLKAVDLRPLMSPSGNEPSWLQFTIPCPQPDDHEEEVYDDLCYVTFSSYVPELISGGTQLESKRDYVIKELIDTENNYVEVLSKIQKYYMNPLKNMMDTEHFKIIFSNIDELLETHTGFSSQLRKVANGDKTVKISSIFLQWREKFLSYGVYCSNLTEATTLLQELCDKNELLNQCIIKYDKEANNGKFKLRDVLQVPLQRILKYHLLLEKLCESTDHNDEEYIGLDNSREAMIDVAKYINEAARDRDLINVVTEINKNMLWEHGNDFDLQVCGKLLKDGEIKVKDHGDTKPRTRYVFIFDKYMILCKQNKQQFLFRNKLDLAEFMVDDSNNRALLNQGIKWNYQWHLHKPDFSVVYTMSVRSIEIKTVMIKAIREAIDNVKPQSLNTTNHAFALTTFRKPATCTRCLKYLKGLFFQGYECKTCKMCVHKECIHNSGRCGLPTRPNIYIPHLQDKLWFAGEKDRLEASSLLENRRNGTFLVRIRSHDESDKFALSLKYNTVKHMKICCSEQKYYLSKSKYFNSIEELVNNYMEYSLRENFERLEEDAKLIYPYRQLICKAKKSYHSQDPKHLSFEEGEEVIVINTSVNDVLWKGMARHKVGLFVKEYVVQLSEADDRDL